ncbi:unnamed protein product [Enterobius vermicularis]|uniref:DUF1084 domain-containing protein n=1 Tax=Enterobius vermicularis TaxID=51028 RepID=A0A0N4UYF8_ENTVE|nr:unnamed protein product [Enterobius vermicularis]
MFCQICCGVRIFNLHRPARPDYHKIVLFYVLFLQAFIGLFKLLYSSLEWLLGWKTQPALFNIYARALELLIICHFYLTIVCVLMRWNNHAATRLPLLTLTLMFIYFTFLLAIGLVFAVEPWRECRAPYWIWLSAGNVLTVQMILFSFALIIRRLNSLSSGEGVFRRHKQQFFSLLWAFETSTLVDLGYHTSLFLLAGEQGCSFVFNHNQVRYSLIKIPYEIITFLLPIWVILVVFRPSGKSNNSYNDEDSDFTFLSDSRPRSLSNVVVVRNWRRRYRPLGSSQWSFVNPATQVNLAQRARRPPSKDVLSVLVLYVTLRKLFKIYFRSQSAPLLIARPNRRNSLSHSLISSPLYPIPEEVNSSHSLSTTGSGSGGNTSIEPVVDSD